MKFSFVIPTHGDVFNMLFNDCINSFQAHNGTEHEIIIVDDGSEQRVQSRIAQECIKRNIKFLINQENLGFSKTCNKGMEIATGDIIVLLNNDVRFTRNVIRPLIQAFEMDPRVGVVGALLFYPEGTIQHGGIFSTAPGNFGHRGYHQTYEAATNVHKPEYLIAVTGALFAIRREAMNDIGLMNKEYYLACDDTEYCMRSWQKNWRVLYYPEVQAIHAEGATRGKNNHEKLRSGQKRREWYLREMETCGKFNQDIPKFDWPGTHEKVRIANTVVEVPKSTGTSFKKVYGTGTTTFQQAQKSSTGKIIGIRRTGALGDVILTTGIVRRIRQLFPAYDIWFATVCPDVFKNNPHVHKVVRTIEEIPGPEHVFDLDQAYELQPKMPMVEAYARRAFGDQIEFDMSPELYSTEADKNSVLAKLDVNFEKERVAILHMSVGWDNRTLPKSRWNDVSKRLASSGYRVVVIGRGADYSSDLYRGVINLIDRLTIHEIRELMKKSSVFVGMDSGMLHIAMTTDLPAVAIFTVANPDYRIIQRQAKTVALSPRVECRFCLHEAPPPVNFIACKFGTNSCLDDFTADAICEAVKEVSQ